MASVEIVSWCRNCARLAGDSGYETVAFVKTFRYPCYGIRSLDCPEVAEERDPALEALNRRMPESLPLSGKQHVKIECRLEIADEWFTPPLHSFDLRLRLHLAYPRAGQAAFKT